MIDVPDPQDVVQDEIEHHGLIDIPLRPIHPKPFQTRTADVYGMHPR